jgi:serine protease Do
MRALTTFPKQGLGRVVTLLAVTLGGLACLVVATAAVPNAEQQRDDVTSLATVEQISRAFTVVTKKVAPSVVYIDVEKAIPVSGSGPGIGGLPPGFDEQQLRRFFGDQLPQFQTPQQPRRAQGQGSGFIISEDGYILTNNHVVGDADRMMVTMADGRQFAANLVGADPRSDVAVIRVEASGLPSLKMGDSSRVQAGEMVLAVGSPFGLAGTVTSGIVSATGRDSMGIADYENFIQTDAAINPGNSGGPLVNLQGEVIGINTAIASRTGGYMGIGFAIPINMARAICDQLIETGSVSRGFLGVAIQDLTGDLAESFGIDRTDGVLISDVTADSPAAKAGLQSGDVIIEFNGGEVKKMASFRNLVAQTAPGSDAEIVVLRDGKAKRLQITIGTLAEKAVARAKATDKVDSLGFSVQPMNEELAERLGFAGRSGVVVSDVQSGSAAARAGLEPGMLIEQVNRSPVGSVDEFRQAIGQDEEHPLLLRVRQGDFSRYVVIPRDNG